MDSDRLRSVLLRAEYGTLEFKREWYKLDSPNPETKRRQRAELAKDILSLANGNSIVAGDEAYLIIGADNTIGVDGKRQLFDVDPEKITPLAIRDVVNRLCTPALEEVYCDTVVVDGKRVVVVTIPASPHAYETTVSLDTAGGSYDKYTVFVRHSEGVVSASTRERANLLRLKQISYRNNHGAPPVLFGSIVGALAGGAIASSLSGERLVATKQNWAVAGFFGATAGAWFGLSAGYVYRTVLEMRPQWLRIPPWARAVAASGGLAGGLVTWLATWMLRRAIKRNVQASRTGVHPVSEVHQRTK